MRRGAKNNIANWWGGSFIDGGGVWRWSTGVGGWSSRLGIIDVQGDGVGIFKNNQIESTFS